MLGSSTVYPEATTSAFEIAADLGYDGLELVVGIDPISTDIDYVAKLQDYHQVAICSIHAPCLIITQTVWGNDPWEKLRISANAAKRLGANVVVVHPPFAWQRDYARDFPRRINELCDETGITFAVENMYPWRTPAGQVAAYAPSYDPTDQPYRHLTLDISHAATSQVRATDYVDAWGDRLAHVHLTDGAGSAKDEHLFPGEGTQNAWAVVDKLVARGFEGHFVHEINTRKAKSKADRERSLGEALAETRRHLGQA